MISSELKTVRADPWELASRIADQLKKAKGDDVGAIEVGIIDIYDTIVDLYTELFPRLASLKSPSPDDLLGELAELRIELEHLRYHAVLALEGTEKVANYLRERASEHVQITKKSQESPGKVALADLLDAGLLKAEEELISEPRRGERFNARLKQDGTIEFRGRRYKTPSEFASHVAGGQRNGWVKVLARSKPLDEYRKIYLTGSSREV